MKFIPLLFLFACSTKEPIRVITLIGQSNMSGMEDKKREFNVSTDSSRVYIMNYALGHSEFMPMVPGVNSSDGPGKIGIQTYLGEKLLTDDVYLLQAAQSGQALKMWDKDDYIGRYLFFSVEKIKARYKADFPFAVFSQGETDAMLSNWDSAKYQHKVEDLIFNFRDVTRQNTRFLIVEFPECFTNIPPDRRRQIKSIQHIIASQPGNSLIPSINDSCKDGIHLAGYEMKAGQIFKLLDK